jgi:di/tricarboxylate transporter
VAVERSPPGEEGLSSLQIGLGEAAVAPRSKFEGRTLRDIKFRERYGLTVLGLWRAGQAILSGLPDVPLQVGDAFLLQGPRRQFELLAREPDLILLTEVERTPRTGRAPLAAAVLAAAMLPVVLGWAPISLAALGGGLLMVLTGCVRIEEAYRSIEWKVIFLMAGILPLGAALQKSGAADLIARHLLGSLAPLGLPALLLGVFLLTMGLGVTISSTAAAILMAPVAAEAGLGAGADPRTLMLAVAYGASTSFMTPVGNQSNTLVMGPGGYRFLDFVRVGGPLTALVALLVGLALSIKSSGYPG